MGNTAAIPIGGVALFVLASFAAGLAPLGAAAAATAVIDRNAKLRSGPGAGYHTLATLPRGTAVDVRGCSGGWCEIAWAGGRGYVGQNLLVLAGTPPAAAARPGVGYDENYHYPGFDYPGIAYAPTSGVTAPLRWPHRRWSRAHQRPAAWRALPPQLVSPALRPPERTFGRASGTLSAPSASVGGHHGEARPTVGSTFSDPGLSAPARSGVPVPPLPVPAPALSSAPAAPPAPATGASASDGR